VKQDTKLTRYQLLSAHETIAPSLPRTEPFTREELSSFLETHQQFVLKRAVGCRGLGMVKVAKIGDHSFEIHYDRKKRTFNTLEALCVHVEKGVRNQHYLIQEFIDLACIDERPFDLRVIVQRRGNGPWRVTGKYAKRASDGCFKTNLALGAGVMPVKEAIQRSDLKEEDPSHLIQQVDQLALATAKALDDRFQGQRIWGMDMGIDKDGTVYLIEANLSPGLKGFRKLKDPRMYQRIRGIIRYNRNRGRWSA